MSNPPVRAGLFNGAAGGMAGGLGGALLGHVLVTLCLRAGGEYWLKGPYGPGQFFAIALYLGALYGGIGLGLSLRPAPAILGLLCPFVSIALPMAVLTHLPQPMNGFMGLLLRSPGLTLKLMRWMGIADPVGLAWTLVVIAVHTAGTWGTTLALGALLSPARRARAALFAVIGTLAGYLVLEAFLRLVPSYAQGRWVPASFIPSPLDLLTGMLIGAGMGAGIYLAGRSSPGPRDMPSAN